MSQMNKMELLRNIIKQFYQAWDGSTPKGIDTMDERSLIDKLRNYLQQKRYVVVLDNLLELDVLGFIKDALPDNNNGSRIIITSFTYFGSCAKSSFDHVHSLHPLPQAKAWELFSKKAFQSDFGGRCPRQLADLSLYFIKRCERLQLAVAAIDGLLSTKDKVFLERQHFNNKLIEVLETNHHLTTISRILSLCYRDLSYFVRSCLLYFVIFPGDRSVSCARLIRSWIAEGFVEAKKGKTLEEVAEAYLNELIHRSLVQVSREDFDGKARSCRVGHLMHRIILSKIEQLNFCQVVGDEDAEQLNFCQVVGDEDASADGRIRRLSFHKTTKNALESIGDDKIRSVFLSKMTELPESFMGALFANFKLLKVLDFQDAHLDYLPDQVGNLFHLKYLSVRGTKIEKLPKSIGKLHNLETLDMKRSLVYELPFEINKLHKLRHLLAYRLDDDNEFGPDTRRGVKMQGSIGCLETLQKLYCMDASHSVGLIRELTKLKQLRRLGITKLKRKNGTTVCAALEKMSHLHSLSVSSTNEGESLELQSLSSPPLLLQRLYLRGRLEKLPDWIPLAKSLVRIHLYQSRLRDHPMKVLQALPNLLELGLHDGCEGDQLHFEEGGFQKLRELTLQGLNMLSAVRVDFGALPLLGKLIIAHNLLMQVLNGIHNLQNLKTLVFYDAPRELTLNLLPDKGKDYQQVEHIPDVQFRYRIEGQQYETNKLSDSNMLKHLQG